MRVVRLAALAACSFASIASGDFFDWTIDVSQSSVNVDIRATVNGFTLSDSDASPIAGTIRGTLDPFAFPFEQIQLTEINGGLTRDLNFDLTVFILGGVRAQVNDLTLGIPGPNGLGSPGAAVPVSGGVFAQVGNQVELGGVFAYQGVGSLGAPVGSGSINLLDISPVFADFAGTVTQSPGNVRLQFPLDLQQATEVNGVTVDVIITGNVVANAPSDATGLVINGDGSWTNAAHWSGGLPTTVNGRRVYLGPVTDAPATITDAGGTIDTLRIKNDFDYTLEASSDLVLSRLDVLQGSHTFNGTIIAPDATDLVADLASETAFTAGLIRSESTATLIKRGGGTLVAEFVVNRLDIEAGVVRGGGTADSLAISPGGRLDLGDSTFRTLPAELTNVAGLIAAGYAGGNWNGSGIASSTLLPNEGVGYGVFASEGTTALGLIARKALLGDANLDSAVNFNDLLTLARNFGNAGLWFDGDFDYDSAVGFGDLLALARNFGATPIRGDELAQLDPEFVGLFETARTVVPEPAALSVLLGAAVLATRRR